MLAEPKDFKTYEEQVDLLSARGMRIGDRHKAVERLRGVNYYRLSGYWYPFRKLRIDGSGRTDRFLEGTSFEDVVRLYDFDARLRISVFAALSSLEIRLRALLGHELGRVDPLIHLESSRLGPVARSEPEKYKKWRESYDKKLSSSREDFIKHHRENYGGRLPIWVAVEILDWGGLTHLYAMSPDGVRTSVSKAVALTAPQLGSWMKSLNVLRNIAAHHGRMFNRVYDLQPKLPKPGVHEEVTSQREVMNRLFGQLTLVQYLVNHIGAENPRLLPKTLDTFPSVRAVPLSHTGAPDDWKALELWRA